MRNFIKKTTKFIFFLICIFICNALINMLIFKLRSVPMEESTILIAGDSHPQRSLDPQIFSSAVNIAQSAEPYYITYWKLRYILKKRQPEIILLGFSHHNISSFNDYKLNEKKWSKAMFNRNYNIFQFNIRNEVKIDLLGYFACFFRRMCLYPRWKHYNFIGSYKQNKGNNLTNVKEVIKDHYFLRKTPMGISRVSIDYLYKIVELCHSHDVIPILIGTPVHSSYLQAIPELFIKKYNELENQMEAIGVTVMDFKRSKYVDEVYLNPDHLNASGARLFSKEVVEKVRALNLRLVHNN